MSEAPTHLGIRTLRPIDFLLFLQEINRSDTNTLQGDVG
jgi:hypothetical protein